MVVASGINGFAKEMAIRKRIASMSICFMGIGLIQFMLRKLYNKREDDFPSLREYNDYLEEVEDMIISLVDGIEARIAQYQRENAEQIMNTQARKAEEYAAALAENKGLLSQTGVDLSSSSRSGTNGAAQGQYVPTNALPHPMSMMGPQPLPLGPGHEMLGLEHEDEETMKLRAEKAARAGGWSIEMSRKRALEEAFSSIWI
ncbi:hypothetical protein OROGR_021725 [Orobanche gracilis]